MHVDTIQNTEFVAVGKMNYSQGFLNSNFIQLMND